MKYDKNKAELLNDKLINKENRELFKKFLDYEEYKLTRTNNLSKLDDGCYKTLIGYVQKLKNVNKWFNNKPLKDITKNDIKRVYDGLEEGKILNKKGKQFEDRKTYYNRIFKSKLFEMINKAGLSREVMEFYKPNNNGEVKFVRKESIEKLSTIMIKPNHKLLLWLAFDIGENINSLLKLKKSDFVRQIDDETKNAEYRVNLRPEILKRSRTPRTEITNYNETIELLDLVLKQLKDSDCLFNFGYGMAKKTLKRAVRLTDTRCIPKGEPLNWKDIRSSMACDLLLKEWTTDEINSRLGHKPSSKEIDKYVTFLAIDKHKPKRKIYDNTLLKLKEELESHKEIITLHTRRNEQLKEEISDIKQTMLPIIEFINRDKELKKRIKERLKNVKD